MTVTLRTVDENGSDVTRQIEIEPICSGCSWRVVGDSMQRARSKYNDKRRTSKGMEVMG